MLTSGRESYHFQGQRSALLFFLEGGERPHVHVQGPRGEAKFWLEPEIELAQITALVTVP